MRILTASGWTDGFLDEHRQPGQVRIRVIAHQPGPRLTSLYFEQPRDPLRVWNYLREVGPVAVARKVASRMGESDRNDKHVGIGVGCIVEADPGSQLPSGAVVIFLATAHPRGQERIVLDEGLVATATESALVRWAATDGSEDGFDPLILPWEETGLQVPESLIAWSPHSGMPLDIEAAQGFLGAYEPVLGAALGGGTAREPRDRGSMRGSKSAMSPEAVSPGPEPMENRASAEIRPPSDDRLRAVIMGYGHYAKISIIPNLDAGVVVDRVHEIDPTQLGPGPHEFDVDSCPGIRSEGDIYFLAGFHHTHAPLAVEALARGGSAVIEKPIATTHDQLDALLAAMDAASGGVYVGFHKRYQPFNRWAREDLEAGEGDPISYYTIAYEVPLPPHHWYRWPASGSRLLSNGCHWIDHFLYLNAWSEPRSLDVASFPSGDVSVQIVLDNTAAFQMVLTDQGGARVGVQDHVELRCAGRTVRIRNGREYESEDDRRILRRDTENKTIAYRRMYQEISADIVGGGEGDQARSVEVSGRTVLELEDRLARIRAASGASNGRPGR